MSETTIPGRDAPARLQDYAAERASFRVEVPGVFNPVVNLLETWAAEAPDDLALLSLGPAGQTVAEQTVADLVAEARRFGRALLDLGVYPVSFAQMLLGDPGTVAATGSPRPRSTPAPTSPR